MGTRRPSRQVADLLADVFNVPQEERGEFVRFARGRSEGRQEADEPIVPLPVNAIQAAPAVEPAPISYNGHAVEAAEVFRKGLLLFRELGDKLRIVECIAGLAAVAADTGQPERAAQLFGSAEAVLTALGTGLDPADQIEYEHNVAHTRSLLPEEQFSASWAKGRTMRLEQALVYALNSTPNIAVQIPQRNSA